MTITEADVIASVQARTALSVQTSAEATALTNTTANLLYNSASRTQGNFSLFYTEAQEILTEDLTRIGKVASDLQKTRAYAYIIGYLFEAKDPDIFAKSVSFDGYAVSRDGQSGYLKAYQALIGSLPLVSSGAIAALQDSDGLIHVRDHDQYQESWRLTGLDSGDIDPF